MKHIEDFRTLGFYKLDNRFGVEKEYYYYTSITKSEKTFAYNLGDDYVIHQDWGDKWSSVEISEVAKQKILACREEFKKMLISIYKNDGTFNIAKGERYVIAYRREHYKKCRFERCFYNGTERGDLYRFIFFFGGGRVTQFICTAEDLIDHFSFETLMEGFWHRETENNLEKIRGGNFPLLKSAEKNDRYLYLVLKYMAGIATQAEADEASAIDKKVRFVSEDKVYGEGVTIIKTEQIHPTYFNRSEKYFCKLAIDSREWYATWYVDSNKLYINQYRHSWLDKDYIEITDELKESIKKQAVKIYDPKWSRR